MLRDIDIGDASAFLQFKHQIDELRAHGHIKRSQRLSAIMTLGVKSARGPCPDAVFCPAPAYVGSSSRDGHSPTIRTVSTSVYAAVPAQIGIKAQGKSRICEIR